MTIPSFSTIFNVPLTCEDCIRSVKTSLHSLTGITKVDADLANQLVSIHGTAPPSAIVRAIQETGRDAILRGSGAANSAAVCILETHAPKTPNPIRGLLRMVQVAPSLTIIDLSIRGLSPGIYTASIRESGDISRGPESTGGLWEAATALREKRRPARNILGTVEVSKGGVGAVFVDRPLEVWEVIGRSVVVSRNDAERGEFELGDENTLVGVVARSAGVWENEKTVCSCSGKTVWEERREQVQKGIE